MGIKQAVNSHYEYLVARASFAYVFPAYSHRLIAIKLPYAYVIPLASAGYNSLLINFDTILELAPIPRFFPMMGTLPATTRNTFITSSGMRNIESFSQSKAA
jgi:hypothetical protein